MTNLMSFDIEGFIEASHDSMYVPQQYISAQNERREIEINTNAILETLDETDSKATFFILGRIARDIPKLVQSIANQGNEIACHGFEHKRLFNMSQKEVRKSLKEAKNILEQVSGSVVTGFRAPDFSIVESNLYVHDILTELGFKYDSSVYPISMHDVYGMNSIQPTPFRLSSGLIEIPMSTVRIFFNLPFGGGGYFRLYPLWLTLLLVKLARRQGRPFVFYLHPYEIGNIVPRIKEVGFIKKFRTYNGVHGVKFKLRRLLELIRFSKFIDYVERHWI